MADPAEAPPWLDQQLLPPALASSLRSWHPTPGTTPSCPHHDTLYFWVLQTQGQAGGANAAHLCGCHSSSKQASSGGSSAAAPAPVIPWTPLPCKARHCLRCIWITVHALNHYINVQYYLFAEKLYLCFYHGMQGGEFGVPRPLNQPARLLNHVLSDQAQNNDNGDDPWII